MEHLYAVVRITKVYPPPPLKHGISISLGFRIKVEGRRHYITPVVKYFSLVDKIFINFRTSTRSLSKLVFRLIPHRIICSLGSRDLAPDIIVPFTDFNPKHARVRKFEGRFGLLYRAVWQNWLVLGAILISQKLTKY